MGKTLHQQLEENLQVQLSEYETEMRSHCKDEKSDFYADLQIRKRLDDIEDGDSVAENLIRESMISERLKLLRAEYDKLFALADTFAVLEQRITNGTLNFDEFRDLIPSEAMSLNDIQLYCLVVMPSEGHVMSIDNLIRFTKKTAVPGVYQSFLKKRLLLNMDTTQSNLQLLSEQIKEEEALVEELSGDHPDIKDELRTRKQRWEEISSQAKSIVASFDFLNISKSSTEEGNTSEQSNDRDSNAPSNS